MPTAKPSTAATIGFFAVEIASRKSMATRGPSPAAAAMAKSLMSLPLVKVPPAPVSRIARIEASASAAAIAAIKPA